MIFPFLTHLAMQILLNIGRGRKVYAIYVVLSLCLGNGLLNLGGFDRVGKGKYFFDVKILTTELLVP